MAASFDLSPEKRARLAALLQAEGLAGAAPERITARSDRTGDAPLTCSQRRIWLLEQFLADSALYNVPAAVHLHGPLDAGALRRALDELVRRHEVLRTAFPVEDERPVQRVRASLELELPVEDLSELAPGARLAEGMRRLVADFRRPFDLASGPLVRARLWLLDDGEHLFLLAFHHAVSDGVTIRVLFEELETLYAAARAGRASDLPEPELQLADYAVWQESWLAGDAVRAELDYWRAALAGELPQLELPTDRPRGAEQTFAGAWVSRALDPELLPALEALARAHNATLFMTLLAGFQALLHRTAGQTDVLVGSPVGMRGRTELERMPGFFVNTLALRVEVSGDEGFGTLVERARATALSAFGHQEVPFERVVEAVQPERDLSRTPIFQVMYDHRRALAGGLRLGEAEGRLLGEDEVHSGTTKVDLCLYTEVRGDGRLVASLEYNTDLFDEGTARRMLARLENLLRGAAADPDLPLAELPLLTAEERGLLAAWNETDAPFHEAPTLHEAVAGWARRTPDAPALESAEGGLSYAALDARANQVAHRLRALGVRAGDPVALHHERSLDLFVGMLGILKAGGAYVPLDPSYPTERLATMLADSRSPVLVTQARLAGTLDGGGVPVLSLDGDRAVLDELPDDDPQAGARPEDPVYVLYTSGSTGEPKGVRVAHRNVLRLMNAPHWFRLSPEMRIVQITPISFDASIVDIWSALVSGGCVVPFPRQTPDIEVLREVVRAHEINTLFLASALLNTVVDEAPEVFASVHQVATGGEAMSPRHLRRLRELYPSLRITNCYGPTETSVMATVWVSEGPLPADLTSVPIGIPSENTRVHALDGRMQPVPIGVAGELWIGGAAVSLGYLERPELNAERFVPDPFGPFSDEPGARLYRTGDRGRWRADGQLEFLGRLDHQVKVRGHRIELGEIEALLTQQADVRQAVVLAREDEPGEKRLVGYVVPEEGRGVSAGDLARALRARLPDYMVPAAFVSLDALPLTPGGKVDRRALPAPAAARAAEPAAPRTPLEELVAAQWADVLGLEAVSVEDDFFALGGHSLTATILIARMKKLLGADVPLQAFFRAPTVAALARVIEERRAASGAAALPPIERSAAEGPAPLSLNQRGLWFLARLAPESPFYNVPIRLRLSGPLDAEALERALVEVVRRHESLRSTLHQEGDDEPRQVPGPAQPGWEVADLTDLAPDEAGRRADELERTLAARPFDLSRGPLLRALLIRTGANEARLAVNVHHVAFDGWSMDVFVRELAALYATGPPEEPAVRYGDYARWQREHLSARLAEELEHWKRVLDGAPGVLELPTDRPRPAIASWRGANVRRELPRGLSERVRAFSRENGATVFMTTLAAAQALLHRYTGATDLVVGSPVAGRTRPEIEDAIGLFLNIVALRADVGDDPGFAELVRRAREATLEAHEHQDLPFESLVEALAPERDLGTTPIYQVLFSLRDPGRPVAAGALTIGPPEEIETGATKTDLALTIDDDGEDLAVQVTYATDLFEEGTAARMAAHLERLLTSALEDPELPVSRLELLEPDERGRVLVEWNGPRTAYPRDGSVTAEFARQARETPEATALLLGAERRTYRELQERSHRVARFLAERGVRPGMRVALALERSLELVECILGILEAGAAYVPLDPTYPAERLAFMLRDTAAPLVLAHRSLAGDLPGSEAELVVLEEHREAIAAQPARALEVRPGPEDAAYVMYTSGSTGVPKGVVVPHRAILRLVFGNDYATFGPERTFLLLAPVSFDASTFELWGALLHGARLAVFPDRVPTPETLGRAIEQHGVTTLWLTAALFNSFVDDDASVFAGLDELLTGGEALSVPHVRKAQAALPGVQLINGYGPTEGTTFTCCHRIPRDLPPELTSIPIGRPLANTDVFLLDGNGQPVPPGVAGELRIGGDGLALGYLGRPELDAERFVPNPLGPGRLYRTGDLARHLPDGTIEFLGRDDFQVKVRGFRIELGEIEVELDRHPGVERCVVTVHESPEAGKRLVAYVVRGADETHGPPEAEELAAHLRARLPDYMVPAAFVFLERIPVNPNGKVDRDALPEPQFEHGAGAVGRVQPRNEVERHLAELWERVLRVHEVGVDDDFFDLGGHSLLAVRLLSEIRDVFGQDLPLSSLISAPTIASQAQELHRGIGAAETSPLVKIQPAGDRPPVFCICSLGGTVLNQRPLAKRLGPDQPFYGLQALNLDDELGRPARIEDYAERYIEVMRTVAPTGPYVVGGHSFGGVVSYEIARRLRAAGEDVAMLFILDSALPNIGPSGITDRMAGLLAFLRGLPWVPREAYERMRRDPEQFRRNLRQKLRFTGARLRSRPADGAAPAGNGSPAAEPAAELDDVFQRNAGLRPEDIVDMAHWPENNRRIAARHYRAVLEYVPPPYPGTVSLFRARLHSLFLGLGYRMGWDRVAEGGVDVHTVPGGHLTILAPPHVDVLAAKMRAALDRVLEPVAR